MTDFDRHSPDDSLPDQTGRLNRRLAERMTLGLAALVLALFGSLGLAGLDQSSRADGQRGRVQAESAAPERALSAELRAERRTAGGLDLGGGADLPAGPSASLAQPAAFSRAAPLPASTPAPAEPPRRSPRVPTGPPAHTPA